MSTNTPGAAELIVDGRTGVVCEVSADAIYAAITRLMGDEELRARLRDGCATIDFSADDREAVSAFCDLLADG